MSHRFHGLRVALAGLALIACGKDSTSPTGDFLVTATVTPSTFRVGDSVTVRVVVTNRGAEPQTINVNPCPDPFVVTTADGATVAPPPQLCTAVFIAHAIAPGDQYTFTSSWSGQATVEGTPAFLASGTYLVRGRVLAGDVGIPNLIESQATQIQIVR